jgi:signal transduction histidine kinase
VRRLRAHKQSYTLPLIAALVVLLTLLAVLQYQWLGQISEGERQTMQTNLRTRARGFQEEFNQEVDRACLRVRMDSDDLHKDDWKELSERVERWKATATYPGLVKNRYLARGGREGQIDLLKFDETVKRFKPVEWPSTFVELRRRFEPRATVVTAESERRLGSMVEHGYISEDIPAVVHFIPARERVEPNDHEREPVREFELSKEKRSFSEVGLTISELDLDHIKQVVIPSLFKPRFTVDGALDYDLSVVYRKAPDEKSEKAFPESGEKPPSAPGDVTMNMFEVGVDSADLNRGPRWQIVINHRAGSLDAAVTQARTRNLVVSFGILFLLAISLIIVLISSRRSQQLARKQMEFVAGVSHEFRTPLAVIHAISENLADGLITDKQEIEQCGLVIRDDVRRLAGMVEQVLELAGAFRGRTLYNRSPVDISNLIDQVLRRHTTPGPDLEWHIDKDLEANLPPVLADPTALASAVGNILDNAMKYGGAQRWIGIKVQMQSGEPNPMVGISIEDRGIGIPPGELLHIFDPFYRGTEVRAAQIHGSGLGLSLVKNIIEANGGTVTVVSTPGQGSSFTLKLPVAVREEQSLAGVS